MDAVKRRCKQKIYDIGVQYYIAYRDKSCTYTRGNRFYNRRCIAGIQDNYRGHMGRTEQAVSQITDAGTWMLKDKRSTGKLSCKSFQIQTLNIVIV